MLVLIYLIPLIDVLPISAGNSANNGPAGLATDKGRPEFSPKPGWCGECLLIFELRDREKDKRQRARERVARKILPRH
jgi:hypothetical protein